MITNKPNVSEAWIRCAENDSYDAVGDYSATQLVAPLKQQLLLKRHREEITEDISDLVWLIFGSATHYILEHSKLKGVITEERFILPVNGIQVSMKPDRAEPIREKPGHYRLVDFKTVSRYTIKHGPKSDWIKQLNIYAYGLRKRGFKVSEASIECLIKDWSYTDCHVKKLRDYPQYPLIALPVPLWDDDKTLTYLNSRIELFERFKDVPDDDIPECSEQERWATPDRYAVVYKDGKTKGRAVNGGSNLESEDDAKALLKKQKRSCEVEFRKGTSMRCDRYCSVKKWCSRYKTRIDPF